MPTLQQKELVKLMKSSTSVIPVVTGLVLLALGQLAQRIMPLIGRAAYQAAAAGSYDPTNYRLNLTGYYIAAVLLIVLGVVLAVRDCRNGRC